MNKSNKEGKIEPISSKDIDQDGNTDNFWVLVDKLNELIEVVNKLINKKDSL